MTYRQTRSVDVKAEVSVETSAGRMRLSGDGSVVTLTILDPADLRRVGRLPFGLPRSQRGRLSSRASRLFERLGLQLRVVHGRHEIARLGADVRGTLLARLFALRGVRVPAWQLLKTLYGGSTR